MKANKVRTLFILKDLRIGGVGKVTIDLVRNLDKKIFDVVLFVLEKKGVLISDIPNDIQVVFASDLNKYKKHYFMFYLIKLLRYARYSDVIIGAMDHGPTYFAYMAGILTKKPTVGWVRIILDEFFKEESISKRVSQFVYPRLTSIACISQAAAESVARVADIKEEQIEVLYNPYDLDLIIDRGNEPCPKWYSDINKKPTLICVARLANPKGLDFLIKAHEKVLREGIDHNLVICGEGYFREKLERLVSDLGVSRSVFMPGHISNPFPLIKNATAFVLSSLHEGFSGVVVEALALGTPIVSTDCGGAGEILCHGEYGIVVKPGDVSSLAEGMNRILLDGDLRKKLSEKGVKRATYFSLANSVPPWEKLLLQVAK